MRSESAPHHHAHVERVVDLLDQGLNVFLNTTFGEAVDAVRSGNPDRVRAIEGQFALAAKDGSSVRMARSIGRPMRYFLAKRAEGPCLVISERIDEIYGFLKEEGLAAQFHPSYTRMVPAHYILEIQLVGCPDPNPAYSRYLTPERDVLDGSLDAIGAAYIGRLAEVCDKWLSRIDERAPIGVLFSGGVDSGSVFLVLYHLLMQRGASPSRLKAFTLSVDGGDDTEQARMFLEALGLMLFLETIEARPDDIDYREAVRVIEDYKPLDVQAAAMTLALCKGIRSRYPEWTYLVDGDGGDENLKDYPIEDNPELTIRSVLNNLMLYQEGWGVNAVKHSLTYSGGQSRGHVRTYAPARSLGFRGFSPYALPEVIAVAEGIPFVELTQWDHERLYALKGDIVRRGVKAVTGFDMPVHAKRRFQHGVVSPATFASLFPPSEAAYRSALTALYA